MKIKISLLVVLFALTAVGFYFLGTRRNNAKPDQSTAKIDRATEKAPEKVDSDSRLKSKKKEEKTPSEMNQSKSTISMNTIYPTDIWSWDDDVDRRALDFVMRNFEDRDEREAVSVQSLFGVSLGCDMDVYTSEFAKQTIRGGEKLEACDYRLFSGDISTWGKWRIFGLSTLPGHREVVAMFATCDDVMSERTNMPHSWCLDQVLIMMRQSKTCFIL